MVKICVIEDYVRDIIERYGGLTESENVVSVVFIDEAYGDATHRRVTRRSLVEAGFDPDKVHSYDDVRDCEFPEAEVYFCDGLRGACFEIADKLGKDRVYINTTNMGIEDRAEEEGYKTCPGWKSVLKELTED
ncbi:MAG: hypothetical protein ABH849_04105 [Nanoarchaeota archaeon]